MSMLAVQIQASSADDTELAVFHQSYRYLLKKRAHNTLIEKAFGECARQQQIANLRQNAASEICSAARAIKQNEIADETAEQTAEHVQCFHGYRVGLFHRAACHIRRNAQGRRDAAQCADRVIKIDEPGPESACSKDTCVRSRASSRRISISSSLPGCQRNLPCLSGEHRGMRLTRKQYR